MIAFRHAIAADHAFVCDGWIRSYRNSDTAGQIPMALWRETMWPIVEGVMRRPGAETVVAYETESTSDLFGFVCADTSGAVPVIFYAYTKQAFRRGRTLGMPVGVGRGLLAAVGVDPLQPFAYAYKTAVVSELARKIPLASWDAMVARHPKGSASPSRTIERKRP